MASAIEPSISASHFSSAAAAAYDGSSPAASIAVLTAPGETSWALDEALCYGWIDGQKEAFDETWFVQRFTPRRARSRWSKINRERVERLIAEPAYAARRVGAGRGGEGDGRWDAAYEGPRTATVPEDLQAALDADSRAKAFFETLNSANRYAIVYRVQDAKRPETRAKRIAQFVEMCREGRTLH
ncbi:MAG: YdeI/OmpD-associated family protein [Actinobacteria bacterium]|nr:YdeI/OmpD-associated family protein [Actinomycetota bacterium]